MSHGFEGEQSSEKLAQELGISVEDVDAYVTITTNESNDGLVYDYLATFDPSTPREILEAAGAAGDHSVSLGVNFFDEEE